MAEAPQGLFEFAGIEGLLSAQFALSHGVTPSRITMYVAPSTATLRKLSDPGTLKLKYAGGSLSFPNCRVYDMGREIDRTGREIWILYLYDGRWTWRYPVISGEYNIRTMSQEIRDQQNVKFRTRRSARDLMKMLGEKLKWQRVNYNAVPADAFPEVRWNYTRVDKAVGDLCDQFTLRVVYGPDGQVWLKKQGEGAQLKADALTLDDTTGVEPAERPPEIVWIGAPDLWQKDLKLKAVAREKNGDWVDLNKVSYKPRNGWGWGLIDLPSFNQITDLRERELAKESVFRAYQIETPFSLHQVQNPINELWRILPIHATQVEKAKVDELEQELPAWVYGIYFEGNAALTNNEEFEARKRLGDVARYPQGLWKRGFAIDAENGVVIMSEPVYRVNQLAGNSIGVEMLPAELWLRTAISVRDPNHFGWWHSEQHRALQNKNVNTDPLVIQNAEISYKIVEKTVNGRPAITTNDKEWTDVADHYIDAEEQKLQAHNPGSMTKAGFVAILPDGAINQIVYRVDENGFATTSLSRNNDRDSVDVSYKERRLNEKLGEALARLQQLGRGPLAPWTQRN